MCSRSDVSCDAGSKPASTTDCIVNACPVWEAGEWGQVRLSTSCEVLNIRGRGDFACGRFLFLVSISRPK